jgi:hypothetical protein
MPGPVESPISPWAVSADRVSPDRRYKAAIKDASEIAMGAPTSGTLVVTDLTTNRIVAEYGACNPSLAWSDTSDLLAVPQWTSQRAQRVALIEVATGRLRLLPQQFRVLEIHSFSGRVVRGIDSPAYMPRAIEVTVDS